MLTVDQFGKTPPPAKKAEVLCLPWGLKISSKSTRKYNIFGYFCQREDDKIDVINDEGNFVCSGEHALSWYQSNFDDSLPKIPAVVVLVELVLLLLVLILLVLVLLLLLLLLLLLVESTPYPDAKAISMIVCQISQQQLTQIFCVTRLANDSNRHSHPIKTKLHPTLSSFWYKV